jgi:hypothetical protein
VGDVLWPLTGENKKGKVAEILISHFPYMGAFPYRFKSPISLFFLFLNAYLFEKERKVENYRV